MKQTDLLGVMLKAIGFWCLAAGILALPQAVSFSRAYPDEQAFMLMMADTFASPCLLMVSGWLLIRHTHWFVEIACPGTGSTTVQNSSDDPRELFAVILVAMGYWVALGGIVRLPYEVAVAYRASLKSFDGIAWAGISIVFGGFLIFAKDWFAQFAYQQPAIAEDELSSEDATGSSGQA